MNEIVVTGVGLHGALGDTEQTWEALVAGRSAIAMHELAGVTGFPAVPAAPAPEAPFGELLADRKLAKYMSPATRMAVVAAGRALAAAGLLGEAQATCRASLGLFVATGLIAFDVSAVRTGLQASRAATAPGQTAQLDLLRMGREGLRRCHPLLPFKLLLNMPLGLISIVYGVRGANFIVYPDGAQGGSCLEAAWRALCHGRLERALVGGTTQGVSLMPLCTLRRRGRLAASCAAAVPYTVGHAGYAAADAAAFLVLERASTAHERGARALAIVCGAGVARDSSARPGAALWARIAEGRRPSLLLSVGNLDATVDAAERAALEALWPGGSPRVASLDGQLGHQGAAGLPFAVGLGALMLARRQLPGVPGGARSPSAAGLASAGAGRAGPLLVAAHDPDGGQAAVLLGEAP